MEPLDVAAEAVEDGRHVVAVGAGVLDLLVLVLLVLLQCVGLTVAGRQGF